MSKVDNFPYQIPIPAKIWSRSVMLGSSARRKVRLIIREINFKEFQHARSQSTNVTDGQTNRQTHNLTWQYVYLHWRSIVRGKIDWVSNVARSCPAAKCLAVKWRRSNDVDPKMATWITCRHYQTRNSAFNLSNCDRVTVYVRLQFAGGTQLNATTILHTQA